MKRNKRIIESPCMCVYTRVRVPVPRVAGPRSHRRSPQIAGTLPRGRSGVVGSADPARKPRGHDSGVPSRGRARLATRARDSALCMRLVAPCRLNPPRLVSSRLAKRHTRHFRTFPEAANPSPGPFAQGAADYGVFVERSSRRRDRTGSGKEDGEREREKGGTSGV